MKSSKLKFIEIKKGMTASLNVEITNDDVNNYNIMSGNILIYDNNALNYIESEILVKGPLPRRITTQI